MSETPQDKSQQKTGRLKLVIFFLLVVVMALSFVATGYLQRDSIRALGGKMLVDVRNESGERLRADVYVGPQFWVLEMDAGEHGLLRFKPPKPFPLEISIFRRNNKLATYEEGPFSPDTPYNVRVVIKSPEDVRFEKLEEATP